MTSWYYDVSLEEIFDALDEAYQNGGPPARTKTESQGSLFEISKTPEHASPGSKESACGGPVDTALLLRELSLNAYDALVLAWMSEYPIEANILSYGWQVIQAAKKAAETTRGATQAASAGVTRGAAPQVANAGAAQDASAASTKTPADQGPVEAWARLPEARAAAERAAVNRLEANTAAVL
ncbi:MAG: hypothetical protein LBH73_01200, partial [Spirochaetaceae bacterium]|nr:hypothetical protein [Spirochaetaceae bacterium]